MARYLVTWAIDAFDVDTPEAAARHAWEQMRRPGSTANVFDVIDGDGNSVRIDLQEIDEERAELVGG